MSYKLSSKIDAVSTPNLKNRNNCETKIKRKINVAVINKNCFVFFHQSAAKPPITNITNSRYGFPTADCDMNGLREKKIQLVVSQKINGENVSKHTPIIAAGNIIFCFQGSCVYGLNKNKATGKMADIRVDAISPHTTTVNQKFFDKEYFLLIKIIINEKTSKALLNESLRTATSHQ